MGKYFDELSRTMDYLGEQPDTLFLGQAVEYKGTAMTNTLKGVPREKLLEMPVDEEMQMGITNGLALNGTVPISIFPRWNFLLCAVNQLVNHLDRMQEFSHGEYIPKVIVRVGIGSERPLNPQAQHVGDFTDGFRQMLQNIEVIRLEEPEDVFPAYHRAYNRTDGKSTIIVEYGDYYGEK
jgi:pyruvate/2-oxoglutarate/acetoin dehydrogenase E1 component|tara:strand:- start:2748 stop:3287 length:540 start_codon:yes stop_codon:yes gene_type:complete